MKKIPRALTEPWAISETGMQLVLAIWSRGELFSERRLEALAARRGEPLKNARNVEQRAGVAIISIEGPLMRHASLFSDISGATSYEDLRVDLQAANDDPAICSILLSVNSPGGEVDGCSELGDAIRDSAKPVTAYVGGCGASAAYWLASAADKIVCSETAMLGSIGVRLTILDESVRDEKEGVRAIEIVSTQSPDKRSKPIDAELLERLQARADSIAQIFVATVAANRGTTPSKVMSDFGRGDVLIGADAVEAGLADELGSFESTLAAMQQQAALAPPTTLAARARASEKTMSTKTKTTSDTDDECEGCDEEGAKALGLAGNAKLADRHARINALVSLEQRVLAATETTSANEAIGKITAGVVALRDLAGVRAELAAARVDGLKRDLRATLEAGLDGKRINLGAIQKAVPLMLRGEQKTAWVSAMGGLKSVTRASVLDAACSVAITADDLASITEYSKSAAPFAAEPFVEPPRDADKESAELDETSREVAKAAAKAHAVYDKQRPRAGK